MSDGHLHCVAVSGIVPVRKEPREQSEMISQMLIGETATVRTIDQRWAEIEADTDGYEGWVSKNQLKFLSVSEYQAWLEKSLIRSKYHTFKVASDKDARMFPVGSVYNSADEKFCIPAFKGSAVTSLIPVKRDDIIDTALQFLGTPYLWGGRTDTGIDCSGLMQTVYLLHGITIPRDSGEQAAAKPFYTQKIEDAQPGSAVYFSPDSAKISHVGFYLGGGSLLHASASVCIQNIDFRKRFENKYAYNEHLANSIAGIQSAFTIADLPDKTVEIGSADNQAQTF